MENKDEILNEEPVEKTAQPAAEETAAAEAVIPAGSVPERTAAEEPAADGEPKKMTKLQQFLQLLIFTGFMISAGVIQLVSFGILCDWTGWLPWWPAYLISIVLSVIWSFTFNRKFTFKAANNVPLAMVLVLIYYCAFIPLSTFGGDAIAAQLPANLGMLVTFMMMLVNFVTEFIWDKLVVFNQKVSDEILSWFKKKDK